MHRTTAWLPLLWATAAFAQSSPGASTAGTPAAPQTPVPAPSNVAAGPTDSDLLGSIGGVRPALAAHGITLALTDNTDLLTNPVGGVRQAAVLQGVGEGTLTIDTDAALGLKGGTIYLSAFGIYGRGLSANGVGNLLTVTNLEADRALRLFEAWYEQTFAGGAVSVRVGQQAADLTFLVDDYAGVFLNSLYGFPANGALNLPGAGPAFPLGAPAVRLRVAPDARTTLLLAVFDGNPAPDRPGDPQALDPSGTYFGLDEGTLVFGEAQRTVGNKESGLGGTYKVGFWYHSSSFPDQRLDTAGRSLAAPNSTGVPRGRRRDWAIYAMMDQLIWRPDPNSDAGIGVFLRVSGDPGDRNLVNVFADGGLSWKAPLPGRPNDTLGIGVGWARISDTARALDADTAFYTGKPTPRRTSETVLEATYQATVRPWLQLQPDFQYVFNPGGGILNPVRPGKLIGDAAVIGVRTSITF